MTEQVNKEKLKNLYVQVMERNQRTDWYERYKTIAGLVRSLVEKKDESEICAELKKQYNESKEIPNRTDTGNLLERLLLNNDNGISGSGQSVVSNKQYQNINDDNFFKLLAILLKYPINENTQSFAYCWKTVFEKNNPVLINRIVAAATLNVSSTVNESMFNKVFKWFQDEQLIPKYDGDNSWYLKNIHLIESLRNGLGFDGDKSIEENSKINDVTIIDDYWLSIFIWSVYVMINNPFTMKKQLVKYGPPGTGKTYQAIQDAEALFDQWAVNHESTGWTFDCCHEKVQFHPSYSYEDFIEGIRPSKNGNSEIQLKLTNGVFKNFCKKAAKWEIDAHRLLPDIKWQEVTVKDILDKHVSKEEDIWLIINGKNDDTLIKDLVPPFFFIIDEINRAELSRVFGELMYSLEYRGIEGKIKTQYASLNDAETAIYSEDNDHYFFIPHNVYLIGTMNTIDRSIESFDFALRRRFHWQEVMPSYDVRNLSISSEDENLKYLLTLLQKLNEIIKKEPLLGSDYQIGHAYVMNQLTLTNETLHQLRTRIWNDSIKPLLEEYLRGTGKTDLIDSFEKTFLGNDENKNVKTTKEN